MEPSSEPFTVLLPLVREEAGRRQLFEIIVALCNDDQPYVPRSVKFGAGVADEHHYGPLLTEYDLRGRTWNPDDDDDTGTERIGAAEHNERLFAEAARIFDRYARQCGEVADPDRRSVIDGELAGTPTNTAGVWPRPSMATVSTSTSPWTSRPPSPSSPRSWPPGRLSAPWRCPVGPEGEAMKLTPEEQIRWLEFLGPRAVWCGDRTLLPIYKDAWDNITIDSLVHPALYLVVDADDVVVYIGKVDRAEGTVAERFREHHAYTLECGPRAAIPLAAGIAADDVAGCENTLIQYFDPVDNTLGRAGRESW